MRPFRSIIVLLGSLSCPAQFYSLAPASDGSRLYFRSEFGLHGSAPPADNGRVFSGSGAGFSIAVPTQEFKLDSVLASADGRRVLYSEPHRIGARLWMAEEGRPPRDLGEGHATSLSANGRWLVSATSELPSLIDLDSGRALLPASPALGRQVVAGDGTVLLNSGSFPLAWRPGFVLPRPIFAVPPPALPSYLYAAISADARRAVVLVGLEQRLFAVDLLSAESRPLDPIGLSPTDIPTGYRQPSCDVRADRILVHGQRGSSDEANLFLYEWGKPGRKIIPMPSAIADAAIAADGSTIFVCTADGGLHRISADGTVTPLVQRTPMVESVRGAAAGSLVQVRGPGIGPDSVFAMDGEVLAIVYSQAGYVWFQAPLTPRVSSVQVSRPGELFESARRSFPCCDSFAPAPFQVSPSLRFYEILAFHSAFDWPLSFGNPASEGDMVHLYLLGLGPVEPSVPYGAPAPADAPARLRDPLYCELDRVPIDISFAGLAPGMIGVYQVDFTWPKPGQPVGNLTLSCGPGPRSLKFVGAAPPGSLPEPPPRPGQTETR